ncbi:MAG: TldD/PmbA family protein [Chloroflexota bacterium]|nr:TldD/PmbA family protein [Chloroflexota bacterium]
MNDDLLSVASDIVAKARALGADEADAYLVSGIESTVTVRKGEIEKLLEAGSRSVTIRVIKDKRTAVCDTSDFTPRVMDAMVRTAVDLAKISEPDECAGLPSREDLATDMGGGLQLYDERIESLSVDEMKDIVLRAEQAAFDFDKRISNSEGAEFGAERGHIVLANSLGFGGMFPYTAASFSVWVLADDEEGKKQSDYWFTAEHLFHRLASPEDVGRQAASRVVRKLGGRKVTTRTVPVVWDPTMTAGLLGVVIGAASGESLFKRSTFFADLEGQQALSPLVRIANDATLPAQLGSRPFDGEGVRTRRNVIVNNGVFSQFMFDSYYARRTGRRTTGNAVRAGDAIGIGGGNQIWAAGESDPAAMIAGVDDGLYLTGLMGFGINPTTGDFSRGATGTWIEKGQLAYPVAEINVSGNLKEMLRDIDAVANDAQWLAGSSAPSIRMSKLMVSGL